MRPTFYNCLENESNPIYNFLFPQKPSLISKDEKENITCTMDDVRGNFLGTPAHGTTLDAVIVNKNFKRSADINENENGPYCKTLKIGLSHTFSSEPVCRCIDEMGERVD